MRALPQLVLPPNIRLYRDLLHCSILTLRHSAYVPRRPDRLQDSTALPAHQFIVPCPARSSPGAVTYSRFHVLFQSRLVRKSSLRRRGGRLYHPHPDPRTGHPARAARRDVLGIAQTGTGKTAAFVLPMITMLEQGRARARMPRTLILEPTRELAAQVAGALHQVRREAQAQRRAAHRRRFVRRPGRQADARRRRADRHARPPARPSRARTAAADRRRAAGHRRSRPHARHGLHPRHRAHLQAGAVHAPDAVLHRDHAAGNPAHHRAVPAQSGAGGGVPPGDARSPRSRSRWSRPGASRTTSATRCAG